MRPKIVINATVMAKHGELFGGIGGAMPHRIDSRGNAGFTAGKVLKQFSLSDGTIVSYWVKAPRKRGSIRRGGLS